MKNYLPSCLRAVNRNPKGMDFDSKTSFLALGAKTEVECIAADF